MKYREKAIFEAIKWDGKNFSEYPTWLKKSLDAGNVKIFEDIISISNIDGGYIAFPGDYIIFNYGAIYVRHPDVFEKYFETVEINKEFLNFGEAIEVLKQGGAVRRKGWNGKGLFVIKQVPSHIDSDIIPKMQSLPQSAKDLILEGKGFIDYTSQCLIYNENTGRADSWVPSISDVFAEDWEIVK